MRHAGGRGLSHRPPGRLEGPCSPRHKALLAGAWKDLASLHRAALIRDHRRPRTASAWRPRALARRAALRWFGSFDSLCRRTPGGRGSQKWLRGPLPFGRGTASGTSSVATAARRAVARRCWRWWFEVGIVQSSVEESSNSWPRVPPLCPLCAKWEIYAPNGARAAIFYNTLSADTPRRFTIRPGGRCMRRRAAQGGGSRCGLSRRASSARARF